MKNFSKFVLRLMEAVSRRAIDPAMALVDAAVERLGAASAQAWERAGAKKREKIAWLSAAAENDVELLRSLGKTSPEFANAKVNRAGMERTRWPHLANHTPLMAAVREGSLESVEFLIPLSDVETPGPDGRDTALMIAAMKKDASALRLLLPHAQINAVSAQGETALMLAVRYGHPVAVRELLADRRCDLTARDHAGEGVLSQASGETLEILLRRPEFDDESRYLAFQAAHKAVAKNPGPAFSERCLQLWADVDCLAEYVPVERAEKAFENAGTDARMKMPKWAAKKESLTLSEEIGLAGGFVEDVASNQEMGNPSPRGRANRL